MRSRKPTQSRCPLPDRRGPTASNLEGVSRHAIEHAVAHVFTVASPQLGVPRRGKAPVALARQAAMYAVHVAGYSMSEVGALFRRDRTTVRHACKVIEDLREEHGFDQAVQCVEGVVLHHLLARRRAADHPGA